jgi:hypothetical protein
LLENATDFGEGFFSGFAKLKKRKIIIKHESCGYLKKGLKKLSKYFFY